MQATKGGRVVVLAVAAARTERARCKQTRHTSRACRLRTEILCVGCDGMEKWQFREHIFIVCASHYSVAKRFLQINPSRGGSKAFDKDSATSLSCNLRTDTRRSHSGKIQKNPSTAAAAAAAVAAAASAA